MAGSTVQIIWAIKRFKIPRQLEGSLGSGIIDAVWFIDASYNSVQSTLRLLVQFETQTSEVNVK